MHSTFAVIVGCVITGIIGIVVGAVGTVKVILWADTEETQRRHEREYGTRKRI